MRGTAGPARRDAALLGAWLGLVVGLAELLFLALRHWGLGIPIYMTPQVVWGAPLSYALFFAPASVLLALLGRRWRVVGGAAPTVLVLAFGGAYSALQVFRIELHDAAALLLAAGVAWRAAATAARRADPLRRLVRRTSVPLVLLVVALAAIVNVTPVIRERRAVASLGPAPAGPPSVLLLILDTMRAASMSLYGHPRPTTPNLERLARRAVVFERAVVTSSWSNPSHAGIFTGYLPHDVSSGWETGLDETHPTIAQAMHAAGYRTAGFSANTRYVSRQTGMARGFARFEDFPVLALDAALATTWLGRRLTDRRNLIPRVLRIRDTPGRKYAPDVLHPLLDWAGQDRERPFFAFANLMDVHGVYLPPDPHASRFGAIPMPSVWERLLGRARQLFGGEPARVPDGREPQGYEAAVAHLDEQLGRFFDELEARALLDHTVVILTSDHGEEFFEEHGMFGHGVSLYWQAIHVPLVVWLPGGRHGGLRVREPVSLRALPATIAELAGIESGPFPGRSLAGAWNGSGVAQNPVLSELPHPQPTAVRGRAPLPKGPMASVVIDSLHYIRYADGSEELFDIVADPRERDDLLTHADTAALRRFRSLVQAIPAPTRAGRSRQ